MKPVGSAAVRRVSFLTDRLGSVDGFFAGRRGADPYRIIKIVCLRQTDCFRLAVVFGGRSKPLPYRLMKNCLLSTDRLDSVDDVFCGRIISSPTREKQGPYGFDTQNFQTMKPVGSEAVRRVSTLEKIRCQFRKTRGEPKQDKSSLCFLLVLFFRERKEHASLRIPASYASPSRPLTEAAQDRRRRRGSRGRRGVRPPFLPLPLPVRGRGRGCRRGWLGCPSHEGHRRSPRR